MLVTKQNAQSESNFNYDKQPFIFVLMPFSPKFGDIYKFGIKTLISELGGKCLRADEIKSWGTILSKIRNGIKHADIVIADITGANPNVLYETGLAHSNSEKVILLAQTGKDIPFDLQGYECIIYDGNIRLLKESLKERLLAALNVFKNINSKE